MPENGGKAQLYQTNTPHNFWHVANGEIDAGGWLLAARRQMPHLPTAAQRDELELAMSCILGEGQFGPDHWQLSPGRRLYYDFKPLLPRTLTRLLRRVSQDANRNGFRLGFPIEPRYAAFQWSVMKELLRTTQHTTLPFVGFWPRGFRYAYVLTHDVETEEGQAFVESIAELEENFGFRSSFNFVPERYDVDHDLIENLRERGFEIGVHGLKHDGKLFSSRSQFDTRALKINSYLKAWKAVGFRSPLTLRNPEWMQTLDIEYDSSFFDTDPYEPIPGGTMSIWPFFMGHFVELPYTLVQDYTLVGVLGEKTPRLWVEKVDFIKQYCGMALVNTHPDYLRDPKFFRVYEEFLKTMTARRSEFWHALPREVARWWRARASVASFDDLPEASIAQASLDGENLVINIQHAPTI